MFGSLDDDEFANNISGAADTGRGNYWPVLALLMAAIAGFALWAGFAEIEQVTSGQGRVIPSSQIQVVQTLEGGIVQSISVAEGQFVEKDDVLMQIDDTGFSSRLGELKKQETALQAEKVRLEAEARFEENLTFSEALKTSGNLSVAAESEVFLSRRRQLEGELAVLESQIRQRQFELKELEAQERKLEATLAPLQKEANLTDRMVRRGVVPEVELLRLQSRLAELAGELEIVRATQPKIEAHIEETQSLKRTTRNNYVLSARQRLAKLEAELAVVQETIRAASDRVFRAQLKAPVRGIVNKINVTTIGSVVQPGRDIMEIVPIDDGLMIETKVRPQDVAFIKPDEPASVKLTAYDYLIYGDLKGRVVRIGADTISDSEGEEFYQVIVKTDQNHIGPADDPFPVIPGMVATVDIKTGTNTVLAYLMKPLLRAKVEAFRER